jgi:RNA polymerase sigma factor (sigma-70 family)
MARSRSEMGYKTAGLTTIHRRSGLGPDRKGHPVRHHTERCPETLTPALVVAAANGGNSERDRLVTIHMPAIRAIARQYRRHPRVEEPELVQAGVVGFLCAVDRFNPHAGAPLWAYAAWWVRSAMQQVVAELSGPCVLSDRALRRLAQLRLADGEADAGALAGVPPADIEALKAASQQARSLDEPVATGAGDTIGDVLSDPRAEEPEEWAERRDTARRVRELLPALASRERRVLSGRFPADDCPRTLGDLGDELGVSAERVRQIEQSALSKLRAALC